MITENTRPSLPASRTASYDEPPCYDAMDGVVAFDGYDLLPDVHRLVPFDQHAMILVIADTGTSCAGAASNEFWMDMASQHPTSQFILLVSSKGNWTIHRHNVLVHEVHDLGDLDYDDGTFDFIQLRRPVSHEIWPRALKEMVRITKPGGCIQTIEFKIKTKTAATPLDQLEFGKSIRLYMVQESYKSYDLAAARRQDTRGFEILLDLVRSIIENDPLTRQRLLLSGANLEDADLLDALRRSPQQIEIGYHAILVEKLAY